jgi:hypothetical protein
MDNILGVPSWVQGSQRKRLSLQELQEERRRLVEIQCINKLKLEQKKAYEQQVQLAGLERQQKIDALKKIGGGAINVLKAGHEKISSFEKSRQNAKPIIPDLPKKRMKSIYD